MAWQWTVALGYAVLTVLVVVLSWLDYLVWKRKLRRLARRVDELEAAAMRGDSVMAMARYDVAVQRYESWRQLGEG